MPTDNKAAIKYILKCIFTSILFVVSVIPGYELIGNLVYQVIFTVLISIAILLVSDLLFKIETVIFSDSLIIMTVFWIVAALIKQINTHIETGDKSLKWLHIFYYDKPMLLFVVYFTCLVYFIIKLIKHKNSETFLNGYTVFIKRTTISFLVYYIIILIYSFFLVRTITFEQPKVNLIPFDMIKLTVMGEHIDYELFFLFLGNIAIFLPLGIFVAALTKKKAIIILTPIFVSFVIELSQYFLGNGHPDVDDFILNIIGFYIGVASKLFFDFLIKKSSSGKLNSFFIFKQ